MAGVMLKPTLKKRIVVQGPCVFTFSRFDGKLRIHIQADQEVDIHQEGRPGFIPGLCLETGEEAN
jgi:hypothetical protein